MSKKYILESSEKEKPGAGDGGQFRAFWKITVSSHTKLMKIGGPVQQNTLTEIFLENPEENANTYMSFLELIILMLFNWF